MRAFGCATPACLRRLGIWGHARVGWSTTVLLGRDVAAVALRWCRWHSTGTDWAELVSVQRTLISSRILAYHLVSSSREPRATPAECSALLYLPSAL